MPGMGGEIRVVPEFFSPAGTPIEDFEVLNERAPVDRNRGVAIKLSRPKNVETSADLAPIVESAPGPGAETILRTDANGIGESPLAEEPAERAAIIRLTEVALIRASAEPNMVVLVRLSSKVISAMHQTVAFPDAGDLPLHLLNGGQ